MTPLQQLGLSALVVFYAGILAHACSQIPLACTLFIATAGMIIYTFHTLEGDDEIDQQYSKQDKTIAYALVVIIFLGTMIRLSLYIAYG